MTRDTADRVGRIRSALRSYLSEAVRWDEATAVETAIVDALADLRHLADSVKADFAALEKRAHEHYSEEAYEAMRAKGGR